MKFYVIISFEQHAGKLRALKTTIKTAQIHARVAKYALYPLIILFARPRTKNKKKIITA